MSTARARMCFLLAVSLLSGCKSATVHLYTLVPPPTEHVTTSVAHDRFVIVGVSIPRVVDRKELVVRKSVHEFVLLENDQWVAPLREEVRRALTMILDRAFEARSVSSIVPSSPTLIWIDIRDWEASYFAVYLNVEWRLRRIEPNAMNVRCKSALIETTSIKVDDLVRADQALLDHLALSIARALLADSIADCGNYSP
jgi:uncharacterized protein